MCTTLSPLTTLGAFPGNDETLDTAHGMWGRLGDPFPNTHLWTRWTAFQHERSTFDA